MTAALMGSLALLTVLLVVAIVLGFAGRRWRRARLGLVVIGPLYSLAVLAYFLIEGSSSHCTGAGVTFRCSEVTYASAWGVRGWVTVAIVMILTLAPLAAAWLRNRAPSVVAAIALPVVMGSYLVGLAAWAPAWAAVLAAAIAGPPSRQETMKEPARRGV